MRASPRLSPLLHLHHHLIGLGADARDALDGERRAARLLGDLAVLFDDEAARRRVLVEAAEQLGRHAPVGALRAVLVDHVEEDEFALRVAARSFGHGARPSSKRKTPRGAGPYFSAVYRKLPGLCKPGHRLRPRAGGVLL